jgi:4-amino-4-deoxy-L-arabinose transferase-like glycosyltransferase
LLAAAVAAIMFLFPLALASRIPLLDPDEGLHARIAQEMVERGDWIVPRLCGKPFLDKPILYFWAEALSLRIFGMSEAAVRLPGLLLGLAAAVAAAALAWRMFDRQTGLVAGVCYATTLLPAALAQAATHDVALVPLVALSLLLFWEADRAAERNRPGDPRDAVAGLSPIPNPQSPIPNPWLLTALNGLVLGLAILTKGLVGVALVGIAYGGYLLVTRQLRPAHGLRGAVALAIAAGVAAPWYAAVEMRVPGYIYYYFVERHLLGFATATQRHGHMPWWYYLPVLLAGGLPWILYLLVVLRDAWRKGQAGQDALFPARPMALLGAWLIGGTVFLSLGHSKMVTYLWPVFPAVAILAAVAWSRRIDGRLGRPAARWLAAIVWATCLLGPAALPATMFASARVLGTQFSPMVWGRLIVIALTAWLPLGYWIVGRPRAAWASAALAMATQIAVTMAVVVPPVAAEHSARELAEHFNQLGGLPDRLFVIDEPVGSLVFYLDPKLRAGLEPGQITSLHLYPDTPLPEFARGDKLAVPDREMRHVAEWFDLTGMRNDQVGRFRIYRAMDAPRVRR